MGVFLLAEDSVRHGARGVIYGADEGQIECSTLQPVMTAAVYLQ